MLLETRPCRSSSIARVTGSAAADLFAQVGDLHVGAIHGGVLEALGPRFVSRLYRELSKDESVFIYTAQEDQKVTGFLVGSVNVEKSLRAIGAAGFIRLGLSAAPRAYRPQLLRQMLQTVFYFFRSKNDALPEALIEASAADRAELLAIAVRDEAQGQGIGKSLVAAFEEDLLSLGDVPRYFVSTDSAETGSNAFYRASGFELLGQRPHHRLRWNIYRKNLPSC